MELADRTYRQYSTLYVALDRVGLKQVTATAATRKSQVTIDQLFGPKER
jgi:hypothetical protein